MTCFRCQQEKSGRGRFCMKCGAGLTLPCAKCNTELPTGAAAFCFACGQPVAAAPGGQRFTSPAAYKRVKTRTLIQVGDNDARVPLPQAQALYPSRRALGVATEFVHYPHEGHTLREPRHRADLHTRMAGWFDRWVR